MNAVSPSQFDEEVSALTSREPRRSVELPGFVLLKDGSTFEVAVMDLSYDGCKIETPIVLLPGVQLTVSVLRLGALAGAVRWYANGCAGLCFQLPESPKIETPRKEERLRVNGNVIFRRACKQQYLVRVFDLSRAGCKVEFVERPNLGERVWVKLDGLDSIECGVRWVEGFIGGIEFERPIYPAVYELLVAKLSA